MNQYVALDLIYFIYVGGLIGVLMLAEGLRESFKLRKTDDAKKTKRLKMLSKGASTEDILGTLRRPVLTSKWQRVPIFGSIPAKMQQAGFTMKPMPFMIICFSVCVPVFLFGQFSMGEWPAFGAAIVVGFAFPLTILNRARNKRIEAFALQLPDALDLMKRGLSVGHPLNVTIANVAQNMKDPIASEFRLLADQISYGEDLPDAVLELAQRIDQEDMHYLAASITIQHGSGGQLGVMFGTLAKVIRSRFAMRRRVKAISSEGRISALILSALPFLMYGATTITAPNYYSSVSNDPKFTVMAVAVVVLVTGNAVWLRRLVTFKF
jgi:tight adherence protein B